MGKEKKRNTGIVKTYRYFYPGIMPKTQKSELESLELIDVCLAVEEIRDRNQMPIFSLFTQAALAKEFAVREF